MDPIKLQKQVRDNAEDLQNYMLDLKNWEVEMKRKEEQLLDNLSQNNDKVPIRSKISKQSQEVNKEKKVKQKRISSFDYSAWEKFDVEKACEQLEQEANHKDRRLKLDSEGNLRDEANFEKEMGNKLVKKQKWSDAILCYNRAIKLFPHDPIFFANRALCYLKLNGLKQAEEDSTKAIELDPTYVKAYQRRAAARMALKQLEEAKSDLSKVLELEPNNRATKTELLRLEKFMETKNQQLEADKKIISGKKRNTISKKANNVGKVVTELESQPNINAVQKPPHLHSKLEADKKVVADKENDTISKKANNVEKVATKLESQPNVVYAIQKPPHLRSKKPLTRIHIQEAIDDEMEEQTQNQYSVFESHVKCVADSDNKERTAQKRFPENNEHKVKSVISSNSTDSDCVPSLPASSVQFIVTWNSLKNNPQLRYRYLLQIPGERLSDIFRDSLESSTLSEIISVLADNFITHKAPVYPYLRGLTRVRRFGALVLFLTRQDKEGVKKLLNHCDTSGECTTEEMTYLKNKFEV